MQYIKICIEIWKYVYLLVFNTHIMLTILIGNFDMMKHDNLKSK